MSEELTGNGQTPSERIRAELMRTVEAGPVAELMGGNIPELVAALALAQGQMANPLKDANNPHFDSQYATLGAVLNAVRVPLAENGLALVQLPSSEGAKVTVRTLLVHKAGGWMMSTVSCTVANAGPQGVGGGITYMRRYAAAAMCGVAQEDDDGNGSQPQAQQQGQQQRGQPQDQQRGGSQQRGQQPRKQATTKPAAARTPAPAPEPEPAPELPPIPETLKRAPALPETIGKMERRIIHPAISQELRAKILSALERMKVAVDLTFDTQGDGSLTGLTVKDAARMTEYAVLTMVRDLDEEIQAARFATPAGKGGE